jgi:hypothetical protein
LADPLDRDRVVFAIVVAITNQFLRFKLINAGMTRE